MSPGADTSDALLTIAMSVFGAGVVYGAIKSEIANMRESIKEAKQSSTKCGDRLDDHIAKAHGVNKV